MIATLTKFEKIKDGSITITMRGEADIDLHSLVDMLDKKVNITLAREEMLPDKTVLLAEILASMRGIEEKLLNEMPEVWHDEKLQGLDKG